MTETRVYQPGRSLSVSADGYTVIHTADQRLECFKGTEKVDVKDVPRQVLASLLAQMDLVNGLDAGTRKQAWARRWRSTSVHGAKQALYCNVDLSPEGGYDDNGPTKGVDMQPDERRTTDDLEEAQVVSSQALDDRIGELFDGLAFPAGTERHRPILDIDFPVHVYPSTTEGHNHLYLDRKMSWEDYAKLLTVMGEVGILEPGYVSASLARKHTAVRLPWVKKEAKTDA